MACVRHLRQWHRHSAISARHGHTCRPLDLRRQGVPLATGGALPQPLPCLGATCATAVYLSYFCHYARQYLGDFCCAMFPPGIISPHGPGTKLPWEFLRILGSRHIRNTQGCRRLQHSTPTRHACCTCAGESVCASHSSAKGRSHQRYFRHWRHISNHPRQIPDS